MNILIRPRGQAQLCLLADGVQHQSPTPQKNKGIWWLHRQVAAQASRWKHQPLPMILWAVTLGFWTKPVTFLKIRLSHTSHIIKSSIISYRPCFTCLTYRPRLFHLPLKPTALTIGCNKLFLIRIVWKTQWWSRLNLAAVSIPTANFKSCSEVNNRSDRFLSGL